MANSITGYKYIDIHSHLNFSAFDPDRETVIRRMKDAGIACINVGTELNTSKSAVLLAEKNEGLFATVGMHPIHSTPKHHDPQEFDDSEKAFRGLKDYDIHEFKDLALNSKVVAIGECGLDYFHSDDKDETVQRRIFEDMIDLANAVNKPLMLHIRNGKGKSAYRDAYDILYSRSKVLGNLHFYAGSIEEAQGFIDLGYSFSFTGVITFARNYDEVIRYIPVERIMSETDSPYVSPVPYRGHRNEPLYVTEVVKAIASIRNADEEKIRLHVLENAHKFFYLE